MVPGVAVLRTHYLLGVLPSHVNRGMFGPAGHAWGEVIMTPEPSDPLLDLLHALRKKTGIQPIPLSEAERRSGLLSAFAAATGAATTATAPPPTLPPIKQTVGQPPPASGEVRRALLSRIRQAVATQTGATGNSQPSEPHPTAQPVTPSVGDGPTAPPRSLRRATAKQLAAYKKTSR